MALSPIRRGHRMVSAQPARRWEDALPTGNGSVGALVYGNIAYDWIVLNHEDLWRRTPRPTLTDVSGLLPEVRRMLAEGRYAEAERLQSERLVAGGYRNDIDAYQPGPDLEVELRTVGAFEGYRRSATSSPWLSAVAEVPVTRPTSTLTSPRLGTAIKSLGSSMLAGAKSSSTTRSLSSCEARLALCAADSLLQPVVSAWMRLLGSINASPSSSSSRFTQRKRPSVVGHSTNTSTPSGATMVLRFLCLLVALTLGTATASATGVSCWAGRSWWSSKTTSS